MTTYRPEPAGLDKQSITAKTLVTAAVGDHVLIADLSDSSNLKKVTVQTIVDLAGSIIPTAITVSVEAVDTSCSVLFATAPTGDLGPKTNAGLTYNAATNALTATTFIGALTGNAATVTTNANLTGPVTSVGNATAIANGAISNAMIANGAVANLSGTNTGDQTNITGNAATVTTNANLTGGVTSVGNAATVVTNANLSGAVTSSGSNVTALGTFTKALLDAAVSDDNVAYLGQSQTFIGNQVITGNLTASGVVNTTSIQDGGLGDHYLSSITRDTAGNYFALSSNGLRCGSNAGLKWHSGINVYGAHQTSLSQNAAGVIQIGTTANNALGSLLLTNLTASGTVTATTVNKVTLTTPATGSTLTIADGATLTVSASATVSSGTHSGTNTGDNATNTQYSGLVSNANHTGDATGATALTLATVNSNVGSFGSATQASVITVNAKGLVTAASNSTVTPAVGSITGLGTGVATALGLAITAAASTVLDDTTVSAMVDTLGGASATGTGGLVRGSSPTIATPVINGLPTGTGVATANTASTLVARDASGNFTAGTITAALTGTASGNMPLAGGTFTSGVKHTLGTYTPTGTTQTIDLNAGNITKLSLASASGNVTLTLTVPTSGTMQGTILALNGSTARNLIIAASDSSTIKFLCTKIDTSTDTASTRRAYTWMWDGTNLNVLQSEMSTT